MTKTLYLGADPGLSGGLAVVAVADGIAPALVECIDAVPSIPTPSTLALSTLAFSILAFSVTAGEFLMCLIKCSKASNVWLASRIGLEVPSSRAGRAS